jgi:hypothetical protein
LFFKIFISIVEYSSLILFAFVFSKRNRKGMDSPSWPGQGPSSGFGPPCVHNILFLEAVFTGTIQVEGMHALSFMHMNYDMK